ncbi:hypothetical protein LX36DRAFT_432087 [Colletotrichum falcatum]|nr:hypothetical protein LX36DRAFT_432087 [Colletotrichum falcatum]
MLRESASTPRCHDCSVYAPQCVFSFFFIWFLFLHPASSPIVSNATLVDAPLKETKRNERGLPRVLCRRHAVVA